MARPTRPASETILAAPYSSLAVDLIDGPDNWRLVRAAPRERGIICGALDAAEGSDDTKELLVWAVSYAASGGRGIERVGLATAGSLAALPWASVVRKLERIAEAVRITDLPSAERLAALDPRARRHPERRARPLRPVRETAAPTLIRHRLDSVPPRCHHRRTSSTSFPDVARTRMLQGCAAGLAPRDT